MYECLSVAFVGSQLQWAALVADKQHRIFHPIDVRCDVIYMWMDALIALHSRYRDVVIDKSPEMRASLEEIPEELIKRATIIGHESEIQIDRLVLRQAAEKNTMNNGATDNLIDEDVTSYPMSLLTRAGPANVTNTTASKSVFQGLVASLTETKPCIEIKQSDDPLNEFEQNDALFYCAFPHLFPLGKGLRKKGSIPQKDVNHMENQWHGKFSGCLRLQFLIFDQLQRHSTAIATHATVQSNPESIMTFSQIVGDPSFIAQLEQAKNSPDAAESKKLLAKLIPHISLVNKKVPYTAASRKTGIQHLFSMVRLYGPPSIFQTFSLDDVHGLLNLRLTLPMTDNWTFPATENGFAEALRQNKTTFQSIPVHASALRKLLAEGSAFAAKMYMIASKSVFNYLLGTPPDGNSKKKIIPLCNRPMGVFGTPIAAFGVTEEQARGSLHMHLLFWGGLTPSLLQAAGGIPALAHLIAGAINRVVMAHLQPIVHVRHLLRDLTNEKPPHAALFKTHNPSTHMQQFVDDFQRTVDLSNVHKHAPTCYKTKQGTSSCRLGRPVQLKEQTGCEEIIATQPDKTTPEIYFEVLDKIQPPAEAITSRRNFSTMPVAVRDSRVIMYYLKRPTILPIKYSATESTESTTSFLILPQEE